MHKLRCVLLIVALTISSASARYIHKKDNFSGQISEAPAEVANTYGNKSIVHSFEKAGSSSLGDMSSDAVLDIAAVSGSSVAAFSLDVASLRSSSRVLKAGGISFSMPGQARVGTAREAVSLVHREKSTEVDDEEEETPSARCGKPNCDTCNNMGDCIRCSESKLLTSASKCVEQCPTGSYGNVDERKCIPCSADCHKCTADGCQVCKNQKYLSLTGTTGGCQADCPSGFLRHGSKDTGRSCWPCEPNCKVCTDWFKCAECSEGYALMLDGVCQKNTCPDGTFLDGSQCKSCSDPCNKCTSKTVCQECRNSKYLTKDQTCVPECPRGFYSNGTTHIGRRCEACPSSCKVCTSPEECSSCSKGYYLTPKQQCAASCPDGYFAKDSDTGGTCEACPQFCDTCSDANTCLTCRKAKTLSKDNQCGASCAVGYYRAGTGVIGDVCQQCPGSCTTCTNEKTCQECQDFEGQRFLTPNNTCETTCPKGSYPDSTGATGVIGRKCSPCHESCTECTSATVCTACKPLKFLNPDDSCKDDCQEGYHKEGGKDEGGVCKKCVEPCIKCPNSRVCQKCAAPSFLTAQKTCVTDCPMKTYAAEADRTCKSCDEKVFECTAQTPTGKTAVASKVWSIKCRKGKYFYDYSCMSTCPAGTYPKKGEVQDKYPEDGLVGGTCAACPTDCSMCTSPDVCTECRNSKYLDTEANCIDACPTGWYGEGEGVTGRVCKKCQGDCETCTSADVCTKCKTLILSTTGKCEATCPVGQYVKKPPPKWKCLVDKTKCSDKGLECKVCEGDCAECETERVCIKCKNNAYLTPSGTCAAECPATHYKAGAAAVGRTCDECNHPCSQCTDATQCTACAMPFFFVQETKQCDKCAVGKYASPQRECIDCPDLGNCRTCLGPGECWECKNYKYRDADGACVSVCPDGFYHEGAGEFGRACVACPKGFKKCASKNLATQCEGDNLYLTREGTCVRQCGRGFYALDGIKADPADAELSGGSCEECLGYCNVCTSSEECYECKNSTYLNPVEKTCDFSCPRGWFHSGLGVTGRKCVQCPAPLTSCLNETYALECTGNNMYLNPDATCGNDCPAGYYKVDGFVPEGGGESVGGICAKCLGNCNLCSDLDECQECKNGAYLNKLNNSCSFECPSDHYYSGVKAIGRECVKCPDTFNKCVNETFALECIGNNKYLTENNTCSTCGPGYYPKDGLPLEKDGELVGSTCHACIGDCSKCTSRDECTECKNHRYLYDTTCVSECENPGLCTSCQEGYQLMGGWCATDCPGGQWENIEIRGCSDCPPRCSLCLNMEICLECKNGTYLDMSQAPNESSCVTECPVGYYAMAGNSSGHQGACMPCQIGCKFCTDEWYCNVCEKSFFLSPNATCKEDCPEGFYPAGNEPVGRTCNVCPEDCGLCQTGTQCTQCKNFKYLTPDFWCETECPDGYFKNGTSETGSVCSACPEQFSKCANATFGTECRNSKYLQLDGTCGDECPDGTFPRGDQALGRACSACSQNCSICSTATVCQKCLQSHFLSPDYWCEQQCPDGYYIKLDKDAGNTCQQCDGDMNACINASYATECKNRKYLTATGTCADDCPDGFYHGGNTTIGRKCGVCAENCSKCATETACTQCRNGKWLTPSSWCEDECPDGYYKVGNVDVGNKCVQCPGNMSTCIDDKTATECKNNMYLAPDSTCVEECPRGYYQEGTSEYGRTCPQCAENCSMCESANRCTECRNNKYRTPDFWCEDDCPDGYYLKAAPSVARVDWEVLESHDCGGEDLLYWSSGKDSGFGKLFIDNLPGCKLMCMTHPECSGFILSAFDNRCSYWEKGTLKPFARQAHTCYKKVKIEKPKRIYETKEGRTSCLPQALITSELGITDEARAQKRCDELSCAFYMWTSLLGNDNDGKGAGFFCSGDIYDQVPGASPDSKNWKVGRPLKVKDESKIMECGDDWFLSNVEQKKDATGMDTLTFEKSWGSSESYNAYMRIGPVTGFSFKVPMVDKSMRVGLSMDPFDTKDFQYGRFVQLSPGGVLDGSDTYAVGDRLGVAVRGSRVVAYKNEKEIQVYDTGFWEVSLLYAFIWFKDQGAYADDVRITCEATSPGVGGNCRACPGHMSKCVNGSIALECKDDYTLTRDHRCQQVCPSTDFVASMDDGTGVGDSCTVCHENCNQCVDFNTCTECKNDHFLTWDKKCAIVCPNGYYMNNGSVNGTYTGVGNTCQLCHENCSSCNTFEECTDCRLGTYRTPSSTCTDVCPDNYYENGSSATGNTCLECADNCHLCDSHSECTDCNNSFFLGRNGSCVEHCPDGDYEVGTEIRGRECKQCADGVNRCLNYTFAVECADGLYLAPDATCVDKCPDGYYELGDGDIGRTCPLCATNCSKCENATVCTECQHSKYLTPDLWCEDECPLGTFHFGTGTVGNMCKPCSKDCRDCTNGEFCVECMNNKYLNPNRSCTDYCPDNFFEQGENETGRTCPSCEENCELCESATVCTQCNNSLHLDDSDNCVVTCPAGTYHAGLMDLGRTCEGCPTFCSLCTSSEVCLECSDSRYLTPNSSCMAECPDGFYMNGTEKIGRTCPKCHHTCNKCTSADSCTECGKFTYLDTDDKCKYECPPGYYESGTEEIGGTCEKCSEDCRECASDLVCLTCENSKYLDSTSSTCKPACPDGFYTHVPGNVANASDPLAVQIGRTCEKCPATCAKCEDGEHCSLCKDNAYLTPFSTCEYTCPPGMYPNGVGEIGIVCAPCGGDCNVCDTNQTCTQCKNDKYLNPSGKCEDNCPNGYYVQPGAQGIGGSCPLCAENCSLCTSADVCQECRNSTYLTHYDWCEAECQDGYYELGTTNVGRNCVLCPPTCNKCEDEGYCTECKKAHYLTHDFLCEPTCAAGYYPARLGNIDGHCEPCVGDCNQCSSASLCSECKGGLFLTPSATCASECPDGYFKVPGKNGIGGACTMCPENCETCDNLGKCKVCRGFTHLTHFNQCREECPEGYYESGTAETGGVCLKCKEVCNTCETESVCTECKEASYLTPSATCEYECPTGYHMEGNQSVGRSCEVCPPTCFTCISRAECTYCQNHTFLTPDHKCLYTCPDGWYRYGTDELGRECKKCPGDIAKCVNETWATECKNGKYLTPSATCEAECPVGHYQWGADQIGRTCPLCSTNCTTCTSPTVCKECRNGQYLTPQKWCDHECPDGSYKSGEGEVGRECQMCKDPCNTCVDETQCTECKDSLFLTPTRTCEGDCPNGYYRQVGSGGGGAVGGVCSLCPDPCHSCVSEEECTVCTNGTYLHDGRCKARCPDGFYHSGDDFLGRVCKPCDSKCDECIGESQCTVCKGGNFLTHDWKCVDACPDGWWDKEVTGNVTVGNTCEKCYQDCSKCTSPTECQQCQNGKYLNHQDWCVPECPAGYYEFGSLDVGRTCPQCPETCNLCNSDTECTECKNDTYLTHRNLCENSCPIGYYHEGHQKVGRTCPPCEANCGQCVSATHCTQCNNAHYLTPGRDCVAKCPAGLYGRGTSSNGNTCEYCSKDCDQCDSFETCTQCTNSTFLTSDKFCAGECGTGYIETGDVSKGRTCEDLCFWCS
eukprot:TRINITY_DN57040_c0_g1_i1.p1 TRINITY_DN57040_c0_g1~~TRINITY_DN57040_c0_g1_i1.p1  ORF type:complete len:3579 (-),score=472.83 TRINITY_DN57040_c0_g1_i1:116-10780(-)